MSSNHLLRTWSWNLDPLAWRLVTQCEVLPTLKQRRESEDARDSTMLPLPRFAALREKQRLRKREQRARKKEQTRLELAEQAILVEQAISLPTEAAEQAVLTEQAIYTIISIPPQPSSNTTSLAAIPEDGPAPAMPEGTRIQGFGRLPKTGYPQTEVAIALLSLAIQNPPRGLG